MKLSDMHGTLKNKVEKKELADIWVNTGTKKVFKKLLLICSDRQAKIKCLQNNKRMLYKKGTIKEQENGLGT